MKFAGPAPETINGRLAMLAMLHVARVEAETGATVAQQAAQQPSLPFAAFLLLFVYASSFPVKVGAREEDFFFFSVRAERVNGRAAMLGFAALLVLEHYAGACFF